MNGEIIRTDDTERSATLNITGKNTIGDHVAGEVVVLLP
jgi:hypothetical protein